MNTGPEDVEIVEVEITHDSEGAPYDNEAEIMEELDDMISGWGDRYSGN